jgi:hypothetical protein
MDFVGKPFLSLTRQNPKRLHNWYTELQCPLVLHPWRTTGVPSRSSPRWRRSGSSTHKVGSINLYFITPLRTHIIQRQFRILQQQGILYISKTNGYSRGIRHSVRPDAKYVGWECAGCGA